MTIRSGALALIIACFCIHVSVEANTAEREQVRAVINLVSAVRMPYPLSARGNTSHTEHVQLDSTTATIACVRVDDKQRWCFEHLPPLGARAEMLRIRNEPADGPQVGQLFQYVDDYDADGLVDVGCTIKLEGQPHAPVGAVNQFFLRGTDRGQQLKADYQKLYDDGIQIGLKHLGE